MLDDQIRSAVACLEAIQPEPPRLEGLLARVRRRRAVGASALAVTVTVAVLALTLWPSGHSTHVNVSPIDGSNPSTGTVGKTPQNTYTGVLPAVRSDGAMAFDPASGQLILFGGTGHYGSLADTWSWNGHAWSLLHPLHSPPAQSQSLLGYDPQTRGLILIGGEDDVPLTDPCTRTAGQPPKCQPATTFRAVTLANDTWSWNGTDWSHLAVPAMPTSAQRTVPSPGQDQLVTDTGTDSLLLIDDNSPSLWSWKPSGWQAIHSPHVPPTGIMMAADDPAMGDVVAVDQPIPPQNRMPHSQAPLPPIETWDWNGVDWTELHPHSQPPSPNFMAPVDRTVTVISGSTQWLWIQAEWHKQATEAPTISRGAQVATDTDTGQLVALGGWASLSSANPTMDIKTSDTWAVVELPTSPTPTPAAPGSYNCITNSPVFSVVNRAADGSEQIKISAIVAGPPPCQFDFDLKLTVVDRTGRPLPIEHNPLVTADVQTIPVSNGGSAVLNAVFTWSNWCTSPPAGLNLIVEASGPGYNQTQPPQSPTQIDAPPSCQNASSPSSLSTTTALTSTPNP